jgi:hypothetical protein
MARPTLQDYDFLVCEDGIYFGRALKNGGISRDARKVEKEEIIQMFSEVVQDYCLRTGKPLVVERGGQPFIEARLCV